MLGKNVKFSFGSLHMQLDTNGDGKTDGEFTLEGEFRGGDLKFVKVNGATEVTFLKRELSGETSKADTKLKFTNKGETAFTIGGNDNVKAKGGWDYVDLGAGRDTADGGTGNDYLYGGSGRDNLKGGKGDDELDGAKAATKLTGNAGKDLFTFTIIDAKDDILDFSSKDDTIRLERAAFGSLGEDGLQLTSSRCSERRALWSIRMTASSSTAKQVRSATMPMAMVPSRPLSLRTSPMARS